MLCFWQNNSMVTKHPRLKRESRTMAVMIEMYCRKTHHSEGLCDSCHELLVYAGERLDKCPFQEGKTTCAKCKVHCYRQDMRDRVRTVMRYSGPRMLLRHPVLAFFHLIDGRRKVPIKTTYADR